jgi:hypothetical protein
MDSRYVSSSLWFGARLCGSFIGATILSMIGSAVVYITHDAQGNKMLADLRYGSASLGAMIGWIIFPLLAIAIARVFEIAAGGKSTGLGQVGIKVVRGVFAIIIVLGLAALLPLYLTLTGADHPAGLPVFLYILFFGLFCSSGEPLARRWAKSGLLFPKAYWPEDSQ